MIAETPLGYARSLKNSGNGFLGDIGPYLRIEPDNTVILGAPAPEIGTGMHTSLPMLIAEEIGADFDTVAVRQMPIKLKRAPDGRYSWAYGVQGGGGSFTLRRNWSPVRRLAAVTRTVLMKAASEALDAPVTQLRAENNFVIDEASGRRISFSDIAALASASPFPEIADEDDIPLKEPSGFTLIGQWRRSKGVEDVVTGRAVFGIDAEMPGMLHAVIARCPYFDGDVLSVDDSEAREVAGVKHIVKLDKPAHPGQPYLAAGVAVVATKFWAAEKARRLLNIEWSKGRGAGESSEQIMAVLEERQQQPGFNLVKDGDGAEALARATAIHEAVYELPILTHATMEPMNCIAHWKGESIVLKAPCHNAGSVVGAVARVTGLDMDAIHLESTRTGGSFGRRLYADWAAEAAILSKQLNAPVKLVWTREDDMASDIYRPPSRHRLRAGLDSDGAISAWSHSAAVATRDEESVDQVDRMQNTIWADNFPRRLVEHFEIDAHHETWMTLNGPWRAPMPAQQAFVVESFINELAEKTGADPLEFRLKLLGEPRDLPYEHWGGPTYNTGRWAGVLKKAAAAAGWGRKVKRRHGRGIAGYFTFGSYCALVVDVEVSKNRDIRVTRVVAAADAGRVVNPNGFRAQLEGGIMDGLSTALRLKIDIEDGRAVQSNFHNYQVMRIADAPPVIETHMIEGGDNVHGTGEIGLPPVAPALCAALYQATGKRIRKLPVGDQLKA